MMKKTRKRYRFAVVLVLLLTVMVGSGIPTAYGWDFHGIDITDRDSIDLYYMDMPVTKLNGSLFSDGTLATVVDYKFFQRTVHEVMVIINFKGFLYEDKQTGEKSELYIMARTSIEVPSNWGQKVRFLEDIRVSLSNNYYKWLDLHKPDMSKITISVFSGQEAAGLCSNRALFVTNRNYGHSLSGITLDSEEAPPDVVNPNDDDFDINAGNTGDNTKPVDPVTDGEPSIPLFKRIGMAFMAVFNGTAGAGDWFIVALVVIVGLFALGLVIKLFSFVFGK